MMHHTKTVTKRCRQKSCPGSRPHQRKLRQIQTYRPGRSSLPDHNINSIILHSRIKDLLHLPVQAVDLIHKQNISLLQIIKDRSHLPRLLNSRPGSHLHMNPHLIGNNPRKSSLTKPRRTIKQNMIQRIMPLLRSLYINLQSTLGLLLTNIIIQRLRPEIPLQRKILLRHIRSYNTFLHLLPILTYNDSIIIQAIQSTRA